MTPGLHGPAYLLGTYLPLWSRPKFCLWLARETSCGLLYWPEAGSILPLLHLVERPDILRSVYHFVKRQPQYMAQSL